MKSPQDRKDDMPRFIKWAFVASLVTTSLSIILELLVGHNNFGIDLGSPIGAALQLVFWLGIGAFFILSRSIDTNGNYFVTAVFWLLFFRLS